MHNFKQSEIIATDFSEFQIFYKNKFVTKRHVLRAQSK